MGSNKTKSVFPNDIQEMNIYQRESFILSSSVFTTERQGLMQSEKKQFISTNIKVLLHYTHRTYNTQTTVYCNTIFTRFKVMKKQQDNGSYTVSYLFYCFSESNLLWSQFIFILELVPGFKLFLSGFSDQ